MYNVHAMPVCFIIAWWDEEDNPSSPYSVSIEEKNNEKSLTHFNLFSSASVSAAARTLLI